jgi:Tfp pilus assembly PilM family ATPase
LTRPCLGLNYRAFFLKCRPLIHPLTQRRQGRSAHQEHLWWETEQFLGEDLEGFSVDFALVGQRGFIVAARRAVLAQYLELGNRVGIDDLEFDIEPFALYNAAEGSGLLKAAARALLVGLEPGGAHVLLVEDGELEKVQHLTRKAGEAGRLVDLVERGVRQIDGVGTRAADVPPVWIAGVDAPRVAAALEERLGRPCAPFTPFEGIDTSACPAARAAGPVFAVAVGLAYRRLSE